MATDRKGNVLTVGDEVVVRFRITHFSLPDEAHPEQPDIAVAHGNISLEGETPMNVCVDVKHLEKAQ